MALFVQEEECKRFADAHLIAMKAIPEAREAVVGLLNAARAKSETETQNIILILGHMCVREFEEILLLCGNGYGSGAVKLLRTFFERVTTLGYLAKHPEKMQQFIDFSSVHWHKLLTEAAKKHDKVNLSDEAIATIKADFEKVKDSFKDACDKCGKPRLQGSWTKKPVPDMAEDIDKDLRLLYFNAFLKPTFFIHASHYGVVSMGRKDGKGNLEYFGVTEREFAAETLALAHMLLLITGIVLNNFFGLNEDGLLEKLGHAYGEAWPVAKGAA